MSGLPAEEFGYLIFLDHGSAKIGDKTFGFLIVLDGATSHLTAYPCKCTSQSEVIAKLHEWTDTFQMNPKAIFADMAFHHPHDKQAFDRMHNEKRIPTGPHTPWPNPAEMGVRLFMKFLLALVDMILLLLIFWMRLVMFLRGSGQPGRDVPGTLFMTGPTRASNAKPRIFRIRV